MPTPSDDAPSDRPDPSLVAAAAKLAAAARASQYGEVTLTEGERALLWADLAELEWWRLFRLRLYNPGCDYVPRVGEPLVGRRFVIKEV